MALPQTSDTDTRNRLVVLILILSAVLIPWLGLTLFNSKGEPREAIVAVSMLRTGNWVLPTSYGADIPYKPPFLAWIIAIFSLIFNGGTVNEFCSRLPSALALIAMAAGLYLWLRNRAGESVAMTSALVLATSFEVFRSAVICRVDMLLTACIVLALLFMHSWREHKAKWWKIPAIILLLSGAVLTKGPVGALLPCLAMGIYCLVKRDNFFITVGWLAAVCAASMVLPSIWYITAYEQGGNHFLQLAYEENIGRLTGHMGYESHVNPWYYNLLTLLWGMLPWTILVLLGACLLKWHKPKLTDVGLFSLTAALTVLVFYCIPSSKRSVYLLPMYPFMAYGVARLLFAMRGSRALRIYSRTWIWLAIVAPVLVTVALCAAPDSLGFYRPRWWQLLLAGVTSVFAVCLLVKVENALKSLPLSTLALYFCYISVIQPCVLNPKSDLVVAEKVRPAVEAGVPVYTLIEDSLMRYYTANYYLNDRLLRLESADTASLQPPFAVLVQEQMLPELKNYTNQQVDTALVKKRSCDNRRAIYLCRTITK